MLQHATDTVSFFQAMGTVVYCFAKIHQRELAGEEAGRLTYLWLIILIFLFMLYGLYTWGVYPLGKA